MIHIRDVINADFPTFRGSCILSFAISRFRLLDHETYMMDLESNGGAAAPTTAGLLAPMEQNQNQNGLDEEDSCAICLSNPILEPVKVARKIHCFY